MTGSAHLASEQGLLSVGIEMNRSDLTSDGVMNQLVKRGNKHTVKILVEHASDPTAMAASIEFLEVWQEFESELIAAQATSGSAALQPLRMLLGQLPVGHTRYRKNSEPDVCFGNMSKSVFGLVLNRFSFEIQGTSEFSEL